MPKQSTRSIDPLKITHRDSHPPIWRCVLEACRITSHKTRAVISFTTRDS